MNFITKTLFFLSSILVFEGLSTSLDAPDTGIDYLSPQHFHELTSAQRRLEVAKVNEAIVRSLKKVNTIKAEEAAKDIYSDWWCYDDSDLFERRLLLELAVKYQTWDDLQDARGRISAVVERLKDNLPTDDQPDLKEDNLEEYVRSMIRRDQYWSQVVVHEFDAAENELNNDETDIEALRQLTAKEQCSINAEIETKVERILDVFGFPDPKLLDRRTFLYFEVMLIHMDYRLDLQRRAVENFQALVDQGKIEERQFATLYDRYSLNTRGKQRYGSQVQCTDNGYAPEPLDDPNNLADIREKAGLMPFSEYVKLIPGCDWHKAK